MVGIMGTGNRIQVAEREAYQLALELARKYDAIPRHLPSPAIIRDPAQARVVEQLEPVKSSLDTPQPLRHRHHRDRFRRR